MPPDITAAAGSVRYSFGKDNGAAPVAATAGSLAEVFAEIVADFGIALPALHIGHANGAWIRAFI